MSVDKSSKTASEMLDGVPVTRPVPRRPTMMYSFVAEDKSKGIAPTEEMPIIPTPTVPVPAKSAPKFVIGAVSHLISLLIEKDVEAWRGLPEKVKSHLLSNEKWFYTMNEKTNLPNLVINNVEMRWNGSDWVVENLHT